MKINLVDNGQIVKEYYDVDEFKIIEDGICFKNLRYLPTTTTKGTLKLTEEIISNFIIENVLEYK